MKQKVFLQGRKGQAFLALTFFIGGVLAVAAILIAFLALSYIDTGYGVASAFKAEAAATAGAEDGLLQLDRQGIQFSSAGYVVSSSSSTTATVTVTQNSPASGQATILSVATVANHTKKVSVVVSENAVTGQVSVVSWADVQ